MSPRVVTLEVSISDGTLEPGVEEEAGEPPGVPGAARPGARDWLPDEAFVERWARPVAEAVLERVAAGVPTPPDARLVGDGPLALELSVRLAGPAESRALNREHRGRDRATNVLSFGSGLPPLGGLVVLGDLVACPEVIRREAAEQGKAERAHWAHLVVHGTLHLLGFDHEDAGSAADMEAVEIRLLSGAGLPDPYAATPDEARS